MSDTALVIRIELEKGPKGKVVVTNHGNAEVRLWRAGNSWGDESLYFEVSSGNQTERITLKPQIYTRNIPATAVLAQGGKHEIPFDLADGKWEPPAAIKALSATGARLTAVLKIGKSPEAQSHGVWTGELRSDSVVLR